LHHPNSPFFISKLLIHIDNENQLNKQVSIKLSSSFSSSSESLSSSDDDLAAGNPATPLTRKDRAVHERFSRKDRAFQERFLLPTAKNRASKST
jgi:hypothetical protein